MGNLNIKNAAAIGNWAIPPATFKRWEKSGKIIPSRRTYSGMQKRRAFDQEEAMLYGLLISAIQSGNSQSIRKFSDDLNNYRKDNSLEDVSA